MAQNLPVTGKEKQKRIAATGNEFKSLWKSVDSLTHLGLPKSALEIVNNIYIRSKNEKNQPQFLKSILYRIRLNSDFEEDFLNQSIRDLKADFLQGEEPSNTILHSILGEIYWKYHQNNAYRWRDRTRSTQIKSDSLATWDLNTLTEAITNEYLLSLNNAWITKAIPLESYQAILEKTTSFLLRPTLFDFLAHRALDYFTADIQQKNLPSETFILDKTGFFEPAPLFSAFLSGPVFLADHSYTSDSISNDYFAFRIYQQLTAFHLQDKDPAALIDIELARLDFMKNNAVTLNADSLYRNALHLLEKKYGDTPYSTEISYPLAQFLYEQGQLYSPLQSENHREDIRAAAQTCENAIKRFPESSGAKKCKTLLRSIYEPFLQITVESAITAGKPALALLDFKNLKNLYFRLVKTDPEKYYEKAQGSERKNLFQYLTTLEVVKSWSLSLPEMNDFQQHKTEIAVPEIAPGFYLMVCSSDKNFKEPKQTYAFTPFWSTRISYVSKRNVNGNLDYFLLDRESGLPLKNIKVETWTKTYDYAQKSYKTSKLNDYTTDVQGFFTIPAPETNRRETNLFLKIRDKEDHLVSDNFYQYPVQPIPEKSSLQTTFFTDRAIYRPGQTIYYKGIILEKTGDQSKIKPGQNTTVSFYDVNGQLIAKTSLTSNDFGSVNGFFTAPQGVLNGLMTISNESGSTVVAVEEYKRPAFYVDFLPLEDNYKLGESISIEGKAEAYAGNVVDGATVRYRVVRTARFPFRNWGWYWPNPVSPEVEIINGMTKTDKDGKFIIKFRAIPDLAVAKNSKPVFNFQVFADVTDITGETQSSKQTVSAGYQSLLLGINAPEMVNLSCDSLFTISTENLNGHHTPALVTITLKQLHQPDRSFKPRLWERPDIITIPRDEFYLQFPHDIFNDENNPAKWAEETQIFEQILNTATDSILNICHPLSLINSPGSYKLTLSAMDPFGEKIESTTFFTAYHPDSKEVPIQTMNWFVPLKTTGEPGDTAQFLVGSKEDNINLTYEIRRNDSLISREWIRLNNRAVFLEIPIREADRGNFTVNFFFVKFNRVFQNSQIINVPYANKKLNIVYETFRNKLDPGATETWKIRISGQENKGALAEYLTCMYDASLDIFRTNTWTFNIYSRFFGLNPWEVGNAFRTTSGQWLSTGYETPEPEIMFSPDYKLNWFGLNYFGNLGYSGSYRKGGAITDRMMVNPSAKAMGEPDREMTLPPAMEQEQRQEIIADNEPANETQNPARLPGMRIRKDFRETAFFYPSLTTDSAGTLALKFTAPESLTRWKLQGLAHTKTLEYGIIEKELVTQKELMVVPNVPRFVRQGDTVVFSAKIVNLSGKNLSGEVRLELSDAITLKPADSLLEAGLQSWTTDKDKSTSVQWTLIIPSEAGLLLLQYRITAYSENFSDGEEKAIPVLSNRWLVTESLPLPIRGEGIKEFRFDKLLQSGSRNGEEPSLTNYKLTLEFATNPAWYAVQALPSLNNKTFENADAVFASFYSNSLAAFIANSNPKIKTIFDSWKMLTPDALLSPLEKNPQLKTTSLQETPWVVEAKSETERKQKLGIYFDLNNLESNLQENLKKLVRMQKPSGGWVWFEGMPENRWITQNIISGMGHLDHLGVTSVRKDPQVWNMIVKGIQYLDGELQKDFENLKKSGKITMGENHLGASQIQYLYARSYFMTNPPSNMPILSSGNKEAFDFYRKQAEKYGLHNNRYLQGMTALALNRLGNIETAGLIIKSLSEKALHSDEMGMYWAQDNGFHWYQAPIETQALLIEAFDEITQNEQIVEDLKIWLLKQKQTTQWQNPRATTEACYALLLRGTDLLSEEPEVKITIGNIKLNSDKLIDTKKEAGTGYFQVAWSGHEISPEMGTIRVSKSGKGIGWGALYWQYFENLDKITSAPLPISIEKQLFIEKNTPSGPILQQIQTKATNTLPGTSPVGPVPGSLVVGDKVVVRIVIHVDRDLEFVHMKDLRASAFEPVFISNSSFDDPFARSAETESGYRFQDGLGYYQSTTDVATNFFFDYLPKGTHVFEYTLKANAAGDYSNGITTIQCLYAPEFVAHSEGIRVSIQ